MPDPRVLAALGGHSWEDIAHIVPPPGFDYIDRNNSLSLATGGGETQLEEIILSGGRNAWIVSTGLQSSNFTNMFFTIKMNGQPLRDYVRITVPLGQADNPKPVFIKIPANYKLTLHATNNSGGNVALRWRLFGWYYPTR